MAIPNYTIILSFITLSALTNLSSTASTQPFKALVAPITKHTTPSSLYTITLNKNENYLLDLGSPYPWRHCGKADPRATCTSPQCVSARRHIIPKCATNFTSGNQNPAKCKCLITVSNPITGVCAPSVLSYHDIVIPWTDGHVPTFKTNISRVSFACGPSSIFYQLPKGSSGVATLSRAELSLPMQFRNVVRTQFAICLPSYTSPGVIFFGTGPYYLLPPPGRNITQFLTFTPLLKNPIIPASGDYYIQVKQVAINGISVGLSPRQLEFNSLGQGGVKLSTVVPYTTLRTNIYLAVLKLFAWSTRGIPGAPRVKPFDYCLNTTNLGSTRVGLPVPQVDLMLGNGRNWTIFGANSMKQVSQNVACLAFVDGKANAKEAIVIGAHQIEDNFLHFDLAVNWLGFSSSLMFFQTGCGNFNFTSSRAN